MLILSATTDKIQVVLGGNVTTSQLRCYSSYNDTTTTSIAPGRIVTLTNNTTPVDIVASPSASTQRLVSYMSVYNSDTVSSTVAINLNNGSTNYELFETTLGTGERLEYQSGEGFKVFTSDGSIKLTPNSIGSPVSNKILSTMISSDVTTTGTSYANITGLSFPVVAGKRYWFKFVIVNTSASNSTGSGFSINGPSFSNLMYWSYYPSSTTAAQYNNAVSTYDSGVITGNNATRGLVTIEGIIDASASGNVIGRIASENANTSTAKAGSVVFYQQLT